MTRAVSIRRSPKRGLSMSAKRSLAGALFITPFMLGFLFFYVKSLVMSVRFSTSAISLVDTGFALHPVGLANFIAAFTKEVQFPQTLTASFLDMFVDVPLILFFSLFMSVLLNQKFRGRTIARAIFFLPVIVNSQAISGALTTARALMLGGVSPVSAAVMDAAGAGSTVSVQYYLSLLGDIALPRSVLMYLLGAIERIHAIITSSGVQIVIFIAALQAISPSLYEVAKLEGATAYETFWKITFPMVSPLIVTNFVYTVVDAYMNSGVVQMSYDTIFGYRTDYAMGTVFSLVSLAIVCIVLLITTTLLSRYAFYEN
ncbi:lactose ABC transporter permease [Clostridia bacterium]|nr:lactose ABC transporter permease [Clostridia bacterium]